jgi:hypothetical protein
MPYPSTNLSVCPLNRTQHSSVMIRKENHCQCLCACPLQGIEHLVKQKHVNGLSERSASEVDVKPYFAKFLWRLKMVRPMDKSLSPFLTTTGRVIFAGGKALSREFSQLTNVKQSKLLLACRTPSPMHSPTLVISAQIEALQMNDWPGEKAVHFWDMQNSD